MNTTAHVFLAAAVAARPGARRRNWAMAAGALLPDVMMFVMVAWERWVKGLTLEQVFRDAYFSAYWQGIFAIGNSLPVFAVVMILGSLIRRDWLFVFGLCAVLHVLLDLPLHNDDGHPHFWPFTDWIYRSPVSYWDPAYFGTEAGYAEAVLCVGLAVVLWQRFAGWPARTLIAGGLAIELLFSVGGSLIYG